MAKCCSVRVIRYIVKNLVIRKPAVSSGSRFFFLDIYEYLSDGNDSMGHHLGEAITLYLLLPRRRLAQVLKVRYLVEMLSVK